MTNNLTPRPEVRGAIVGVDTHKHIHVAVAIDTCGIHLGNQSFAADSGGYQALLTWAETHGRIQAFGIEGTGGYGVGLARVVRRAGHRVVEVNRADRRLRLGLRSRCTRIRGPPGPRPTEYTGCWKMVAQARSAAHRRAVSGPRRAPACRLRAGGPARALTRCRVARGGGTSRGAEPPTFEEILRSASPPLVHWGAWCGRGPVVTVGASESARRAAHRYRSAH